MSNKTKLIGLFVFLFCCNLLAQSKFSSSYREGEFYLSISSEYRITPIFPNATRGSLINSVVEVNEQNSGASLNYALDWFISRDFSLGFSNSLRFDHIAIGDIDTINGTEVVAPNENGLLLDFHLYGQYHFDIFRRSELFIQLGASWLHVGSEVVVVQNIIDNSGDLTQIAAENDSSDYLATNVGIGWKKERISILGGVYTSRNTPYFVDGSGFTVPYIRFSYNLFNL